MNTKILFPSIAFVCGFLAILGGLYSYQRITAPPAPPADVPSLLWPNPKQIAGFDLTDQNGQPFDAARLRGKWTFWYFGYTNCPDVCPTTMSAMNGIDRQLESTPALREGVEYSFVSVDPARDTLEHLGRYVGFFNPAFIAATGSDEQLAAITREFGILSKLQEPDDDGNYVVDHTAAILLTDPELRLVALFRLPHDVTDISNQFRKIRKFIGK